nr:aquaporin rerated protein, other eukaryote [Cryptococcus depauperatus CBS 7855]
MSTTASPSPTVDKTGPVESDGSKHRHLHSPLKSDYNPRVLEAKNHIVAMIGEYVSTSLFILFCLGGTHVAQLPVNTTSGNTDVALNTSSLFYISLLFGLSLTVNACIFFRVSGGLFFIFNIFNPAVSLGMVLAGCLTPLRGALLVFSQILGGMTGAAIINVLIPGKLNAGTSLGGGTSITQGLFLEVFLTLLLMLAIFFLAAEKHRATFVAPLGIGMALFIAEMVGAFYTGGSLNPARSFGPAVVTHNFPSYHWIYWVGPCLGSILATGFYNLLKWLEYETVLEPEVRATLDDPSIDGDNVVLSTNANQGEKPARSGPQFQSQGHPTNIQPQKGIRSSGDEVAVISCTRSFKECDGPSR